MARVNWGLTPAALLALVAARCASYGTTTESAVPHDDYTVEAVYHRIINSQDDIPGSAIELLNYVDRVIVQVVEGR